MTLRIGLPVLYWPRGDSEFDNPNTPVGPLSATVACINGDGTVNLGVLAPSGDGRARGSVLFVEPGSVPPGGNPYCFPHDCFPHLLQPWLAAPPPGSTHNQLPATPEMKAALDATEKTNEKVPAAV